MSLKCRNTVSAKKTLVVTTTAVDAAVDAIRATVEAVDREAADVVMVKVRVVEVAVVAVVVVAVDVAVEVKIVDLVAIRMVVMIHVL